MAAPLTGTIKNLKSGVNELFISFLMSIKGFQGKFGFRFFGTGFQKYLKFQSYDGNNLMATAAGSSGQT